MLIAIYAAYLLAAPFLLDMRLTWWEAAGLFPIWLVQFALSPLAGGQVHRWIAAIYFPWFAVEIAPHSCRHTLCCSPHAPRLAQFAEMRRRYFWGHFWISSR